jgi:hypothetical protein
MAKCMKCGGMKYQSGGATKGGSNAKMGIFGVPNAGGTGPETMKKGGSKVTAVKHSCPPGTVRSATGGCVSQRPTEFKKGGSTFGMLSVKAGVDKNPKATAADRIAGAKMNKKKMGGATKKKC